MFCGPVADGVGGAVTPSAPTGAGSAQKLARWPSLVRRDGAAEAVWPHEDKIRCSVVSDSAATCDDVLSDTKSCLVSAISLAWDGGQPARLRGVVAQRPAQLGDPVVDRAGADRVVEAPDHLQQPVAGDRALPGRPAYLRVREIVPDALSIIVMADAEQATVILVSSISDMPSSSPFMFSVCV